MREREEIREAIKNGKAVQERQGIYVARGRYSL